MNEAQRQILKMLSDGKITAGEANRLLAAMGYAPARGSSPPGETTPEAPVEAVAVSETARPAAAAEPGTSRPADRVLSMLHDGKIDAAQADTLLAALEPEAEGPADEPVSEAEPIDWDNPPPPTPADMDRFRRLWQVPFAVAVGLLILSGICMSATYGGGITLGFVCAWSVFMLAALGTVIALWSRTARWLHLRVEDRKGSRLSISLPLPLGLTDVGVRFARRFVDADTARTLDATADMLGAVKDELSKPDAEPFSVEVNDDEDGDHVQVYIG